MIYIILFVVGVIAMAAVNISMEKQEKEKSSNVFKNLKNFKISMKPLITKESSIAIDKTNKQLCLVTNNNAKIFNFSDLIMSELIINNEVKSTSKVGRAIVGGILLGGVGAIVGATTGKDKEKVKSIILKLTFNNLSNSTYKMNFLDMEVKKDGFLYNDAIKQAEKWENMMNVILNQNK